MAWLIFMAALLASFDLRADPAPAARAFETIFYEHDVPGIPFEQSIACYQRLLAAIASGVRQEQKMQFIQAMRGMVAARAPQQLRLLRSLVVAAQCEEELADYATEIKVWANALHEEARQAALRPRQLIRLVDLRGAAVAMPSADPGPHTSPLVFQPAEQVAAGQLFAFDADHDFIRYGDEVSLLPQCHWWGPYLRRVGVGVPLVFTKMVRRGKAVHGCQLGVPEALGQGPCRSLVVVPAGQHDEAAWRGAPVLPGEAIMLRDQANNYLCAISVGSGRQLQLRHARRDDAVALVAEEISRAVGDEVVSACVQDQCHRIMQEPSGDAAARGLASTFSLLRTLAIGAGLEDSMVKASLAVVRRCDAAGATQLQELRGVLVRILQELQLDEELRVQVSEARRSIDQRLAATCISYGDIVRLSTTTGELVCTSGAAHVRDAAPLPLVAGHGTRQGPMAAAHFFQVKSVRGHTGPVKSGDQVMLLSLFAVDGARRRALGSGFAWWTRREPRWRDEDGAGQGEEQALVAGELSVAAQQGGNQLFSLVAVPAGAPSQDGIERPPVMSGERVLLACSGGREVVVQISGLAAEGVHRLIARDASTGGADAEAGKFIIEKIPLSVALRAAEHHFHADLLRLRAEQVLGVRVGLMGKMLSNWLCSPCASAAVRNSCARHLVSLCRAACGDERLQRRLLAFVEAVGGVPVGPAEQAALGQVALELRSDLRLSQEAERARSEERARLGEKEK